MLFKYFLEVMHKYIYLEIKYSSYKQKNPTNLALKVHQKINNFSLN